MPAALTMGMSTGVRIKMVGVMSMAVPTIMHQHHDGGHQQQGGDRPAAARAMPTTKVTADRATVISED
jgi:hypothetical protein